ncbi:serine/threonine protein phosphatase [Roseibacterium sp. SDUM158016]|uniref:metallophosphoesterase family protein n=1 Tax=Roseicyclus sediminis TaxID=2980997 RepID=UPI0021D3448E|nr:metallophosphoesterase family protein [Roseibacterium sp. SDUM158016]MCU4651725.1 serine/threonine protein phosphatase [Roseibacterium sp. SDUM158016]
MTIYAIGDIHGHLDKLRAAHDAVEADRAREGTGAAPLVHVGDLVDRGPDSAGVVEYLRTTAAEDPRLVILKGNHDAMFVEFLASRPGRWSDSRYVGDNIGGRATLASYGIDATTSARRLHDDAIAAVPEAHRVFLSGLPLTHLAGDCLFVHAGIRPGVPLEEQDEADLIWIRDRFLLDPGDHGPLVVHGHTPVVSVEHHGNRLAIDTGAAWDGPVTAVAIEGRDAFVLTEEGRVPVARLR